MTLFSFFFLGILSWKAALLFNGEGYGLWLRWVSFLIGGVPHWGYTKRGVFKIIGWGYSPSLYGKTWYISATRFENINIDIVECLAVVECIYNATACESPSLLYHIFNKLFGQWLFKKLKKAIQTIWKQIMIVKN